MQGDVRVSVCIALEFSIFHAKANAGACMCKRVHGIHIMHSYTNRPSYLN
jgi:hypothetical protein